jgi:hypothetical protein
VVVAMKCRVAGLPMAVPGTYTIGTINFAGILGSSVVKEMLFLFFSPYYEYTLTFLAPQVNLK